MESLTICFSASSPPLNLFKSLKSGPKPQFFLSNSTPLSLNCPPTHFPPSDETQIPNNSRTHLKLSNLFGKNLSFINSHQSILKPQFSFLYIGLSFPLSCFASETTSTEEISNKINLESILISVDNFFTTNPFFVTSVLFIWLVLIPVAEEYLRKYKFVSALNAFRKLQEDPSSQLLDIRDKKSLAYLGSPKLKILNKSAVQVEFREGDEDGFVKKVLQSFGEPGNTTVCVIDNFDGNSIKVAELLVKNGFKEAYAIRGGIRGKKGWQDIQETLLPPSVHVNAKSKMSKFETNGGIQLQDTSNDVLRSNTSSSSNHGNKVIDPKDVSPSSPTVQSKGRPQPSSPYTNYPDLKPPSSPTPSKPN